jgi:hypothetical protein
MIVSLVRNPFWSPVWQNEATLLLGRRVALQSRRMLRALVRRKSPHSAIRMLAKFGLRVFLSGSQLWQTTRFQSLNLSHFQGSLRQWFG